MADLKQIEKENAELKAENAELKAKLTSAMRVLEGYEPCDGCGITTYGELQAKVKAYENPANKGVTPVVGLVSLNKAKYGFAEHSLSPFVRDNASGENIVPKQQFIDGCNGKKCDTNLFKKHPRLTYYFAKDGTPNKEALAELANFLVEKEVLVKD
jgi:hypothetical protein